MTERINRAVFLDRDGVITNVNIDYSTSRSYAVRDLNELSLLPGVKDIIKLKKLGFKVIIVSNQPDVALGKISENTKQQLIKKFANILLENNIEIDDIYYCFHHPSSINKDYPTECDCRKPKHGMLSLASSKHDIELSNSWMIGDTFTDILAGKSVGCRTILLKRIWSQSIKCNPDFIVNGTLKDAIDLILQQSKISHKHI